MAHIPVPVATSSTFRGLLTGARLRAPSMRNKHISCWWSTADQVTEMHHHEVIGANEPRRSCSSCEYEYTSLFTDKKNGRENKTYTVNWQQVCFTTSACQQLGATMMTGTSCTLTISSLFLAIFKTRFGIGAICRNCVAAGQDLVSSY